jgi:predicted aspartyl protease
MTGNRAGDTAVPRRMTRLLCLLAVACGGVHVAPTIPITITAQREVLVPVVVDGRSFMFQLDTGASASAITPATRDRLGLPRGTRAESVAAGGAMDVEEVTVHRVRVGDREIGDLQVSVMAIDELPGKSVDGVLGQDVLARYIAEIDLAGRRFVLHARDATAWRTPDLVAIPFTDDEGLIRVDARLGASEVAAILDLGASSTVANPRVGGAADDAARGKAYGADNHAIEARVLPATTIQLGELTLAAPSVVVADLPVFATLHLADRPAVILGMDVVGTRRLVIDATAKRLYVSRS